MQTTANYGLKKPEGNDIVDIDVINGNMDTIDGEVKRLSSAIPSVNGKTGNITLSASDIGVGDLSNNFKSNPKNVENVLAELFMSGTNGKNDIYSAISAKGTTPASKNFSDLVTAIGQINTGKKWAKGSGTVQNLVSLIPISAISCTNATDLQFNVNLDFNPSIFILVLGEISYVYSSNPDFKDSFQAEPNQGYTNLYEFCIYCTTRTGVYAAKVINMNSKGFRVTNPQSGTIPDAPSTVKLTNGPITWYAFE